ncbi:hypothetical protein ACTOB_005117 [Actinoplanes oblitus]|uniref:Uncharacterized protein n=1 Tax=Actinoplanes oblitus TaxID=3040509 RepID=A0ABY8WBR1_9ACTN|nr:hypothetical protein [Actinoplanes oblitus]WIM93150.1 hypothetical protein ACTOB_005117 [Actinoplanes oblitus]
MRDSEAAGDADMKAVSAATYASTAGYFDAPPVLGFDLSEPALARA